MSEQQISTRVLTIPNVLTFVRMGLIPVFATLLVYGRETGALIVFSIAAELASLPFFIRVMREPVRRQH